MTRRSGNSLGEDIYDSPDWEAYAEKVKATHAYVTLFCGNCGETRLVAVSCKDRFCPVCSRRRSARIRQRIESLIGATRRTHSLRLKMITLTQPNSPTPLEGVEAIIKQFKRLRTLKRWKIRIKSGCWVVEIKDGSEGFHVHIHALVIAKYYDRHELTADWGRCGLGKITHIEEMTTERGANYVTKYITKPSCSVTSLEAVATALKSVRLFNVFGDWHNMKLPKVKLECHCSICNATKWYKLGGFCDPGYTVDHIYVDEIRRVWNELNGHSPPDLSGIRERY